MTQKLGCFEFWSICLKNGVPRAKTCFGYKTNYPRMMLDKKVYFIKKCRDMQKTLTCRILAHLVENYGSQGKNRVLVTKQSTLGCDLIKKT